MGLSMNTITIGDGDHSHPHTHKVFLLSNYILLGAASSCIFLTLSLRLIPSLVGFLFIFLQILTIAGAVSGCAAASRTASSAGKFYGAHMVATVLTAIFQGSVSVLIFTLPADFLGHLCGDVLFGLSSPASAAHHFDANSQPQPTSIPPPPASLHLRSAPPPPSPPSSAAPLPPSGLSSPASAAHHFDANSQPQPTSIPPPRRLQIWESIIGHRRFKFLQSNNNLSPRNGRHQSRIDQPHELETTRENRKRRGVES
ncbi:hypothetical protein CASFOL_021512 [Castilleja foliolosa]|uniref:Uncharacterized protein n=1 Tax=Castilleja foliolosa TaxID=1961234 RepID=A0ABD3CXM3_9LAMI